MGVERIEEYRQKDGNDILKVWLKPGTYTPNGYYFYTDAEALSIVKNHTWYERTCYIVASIKNGDKRKTSQFHRVYAENILGGNLRKDICLDHINGVPFDNVDNNLNLVTSRQNMQNIVDLGYYYDSKRHRFFPSIGYWGITCKKVEWMREDHICCMANKLHKVLHPDYDYSFLLDRRKALDLLDLERTGVISQDEATYRHVMRYAKNAWYYYRYGLQGYFKEHHIPVPEYSLDSERFMVDKITGQRLCPFEQRRCSHA